MSGPALWAPPPDLDCLCRLLGAGLPGAVPAAPVERRDWLRVVTLALDHGTGGLLHRAATSGGVPALPHAHAAILARHAAANVQANTALLGELQRLRAALGDAGVETIPLKGTWLGLRLYGDQSSRVSRDIDFLIRPEAMGTALAALAAAGYPIRPALPPRQLAAKARYAGQFLLHREDGRFAIEPHWALAPETLGLGLDHGGLWQRSRSQAAGGIRLPTLAPEDELIMLCVHGFKEDWGRLKLLVDLAQFVAMHPHLDWDIVAARARAQGVWWIVLLGVSLIATVFGTQTALTGAARSARVPARVAGELLARIGDAAATRLRVPASPSIYAVCPVRRRIREHSRDRARYVWRTIVTPREPHFLALPLPDWLFPLYPWVKLLHDYVVLPVWLAAKRMRRGTTGHAIRVGH